MPAHPSALDLKQCIGFAATNASKPRCCAFEKSGETCTIEPGGNLFFNSSDALMRCAVHGGGCVYVLDVLAATCLQRGHLAVVLSDWRTAPQTFYAVYPPSRFVPPRVTQFVRFISEPLRAVWRNTRRHGRRSSRADRSRQLARCCAR